jgi:transcriptional regulator with XRE-family HTH domain
MDRQDEFIASQIKRYRLLRLFSQSRLAEETGFTKQIISRIEKAERKVSYNELVKIAEALDEPIESFTVVDLKNKLISRRHRSIDIPKFAVDFLDDWEAFIRSGGNLLDDRNKIIMDEIYNEMKDRYHMVYKTFKY